MRWDAKHIICACTAASAASNNRYSLPCVYVKWIEWTGVGGWACGGSLAYNMYTMWCTADCVSHIDPVAGTGDQTVHCTQALILVVTYTHARTSPHRHIRIIHSFTRRKFWIRRCRRPMKALRVLFKNYLRFAVRSFQICGFSKIINKMLGTFSHPLVLRSVC